MDNAHPHSKAKLVRSLMKVVWVFSLLPLTFWITLWGLSVFAALLLGHWPRVGLDDPFHVAENNFFYEAFLRVASLNFFAVGFSVLFAPVVTIIAWFSGAGMRIAWPILLFLIGLAMFFVDPGQRIEWFID